MYEANHEEFKPLETFRERFELMLTEVKELGFRAIDLWAAHLHWHWASLEHIAIAKELLQKHEIEVRSYAAWVGETVRICGEPAGFVANLIFPTSLDSSRWRNRLKIGRRSSQFCVNSRWVTESRITLKPASRMSPRAWARGGGRCDRHCSRYRLGRNARMGRVDWIEGVVRSHFYGAPQGRESPPAEPTGFEFIDMGHETCRLGDGVVGIEPIVRWLRETGFRGPMGVEHEPETFDPSEECRESLERIKGWWNDATPIPEDEPLRVAVVGCGNIAGSYGEAMLTRSEVEILGASDLDLARAQEWAEKFGGRVYASLDAVLADPAVEVVVNLTIQHAHVEVVTKALEAGKHVHSEKPLAPTFAEAQQLVALAAAKNLRLSCAPVTWLGEAQQTTWKMIRDGRIGPPRVVYASVDWARIETWHPNPVPFYAAGPVGDVGVYSISLLTAWFGPVQRVTAGGGILLPDRKTKDGEFFTLARPDYAVAVLEFANGITARLSANFYVGEPADRRAGLEIHGDDGSIRTEWFAATAPLEIGAFGEAYRPERYVREPAGSGEWYCDWSAGVYELWRALRTATPHPTSGEQAAHVVEVIESVETALQEGRRVELSSSFAPPPPLEWAR